MERRMKDSMLPWAPKIPEDWDIKRGKGVLNLMHREVRDDDEIVTCFRDGEVILRRLRRAEGFTISTKEIGYQGINVGDIVIHGMDGFAGAMGISKSQGKGTPVYVVCTPKENNYSKYIVYYLRTLAHNDVFISLATGIRERSCDLKWNKISQLEFICPSYEEQHRISDFLDKKCTEIDELVSIQEQYIEELKAYKQSVITEAVTKGLNPDAEMKDSGVEWIGEIPKDWKIKRIKYCSEIFGRIGFRGYKQDDLVERGEGAITLSPSNMKPMTMDYNKCTYLSWEKYNESPEIMIKPSDILFVKTGSTYGKCSYVEHIPMECTINPQIVVLKHHLEHPKFIAYYLQTSVANAFVETSVVGGTIPTISQEKIMNYFIPAPPLPEQQEISHYLDRKTSEIDSLIKIKQEKIEQLNAYKKSLIYEYVTGKKQVH